MNRSAFKGVLFAALIALGAGIAWRFSVQAHAEERAQPSHRPAAVRVVTPSKAPEQVVVNLPGSVRPRERVVLYARTNGFLEHWKVDLGDRVKKGQVLATIDAPEVVANLAQARARLSQAKASIGLVRSQHERVLAL
ncbi:MAG: biotin/lipoyl-binding protein, partial [Myxococcaceae bacterium]|nr:biotin/lipoyl-binding protein [Myxococcaceae bacterium]